MPTRRRRKTPDNIPSSAADTTQKEPVMADEPMVEMPPVSPAAFPAQSDLDDAYRVVHNQYAYYEGLGNLKTALATYVMARDTYEGMAATLATLRDETATLEQRHGELETLVADLDGKHAELVAAVQGLALERDTIASELNLILERLKSGPAVEA